MAKKQPNYPLVNLINQKKFKPLLDKGGYNAAQVDEFLDSINVQILQLYTDYTTIQTHQTRLQNQVNKLLQEKNDLIHKIQQLELQIMTLEEAGYGLLVKTGKTNIKK